MMSITLYLSFLELCARYFILVPLILKEVLDRIFILSSSFYQKSFKGSIFEEKEGPEAFGDAVCQKTALLYIAILWDSIVFVLLIVVSNCYLNCCFGF